jgi:hypothetical protein
VSATAFKTVFWLSVLPLSLVGYCAAWLFLPSILSDPADFDSAEARITGNWFGPAGRGSVISCAAALVFLVYVVKYYVVRYKRELRPSLYWSFLVFVSLPFIWFFVVIDWFNPHVFRIACWLDAFLAFWPVPTVSFLVDASSDKPIHPGYFVLRSLAEILLGMPIWAVFWIFFSFFILGWGWI